MNCIHESVVLTNGACASEWREAYHEFWTSLGWPPLLPTPAVLSARRGEELDSRGIFTKKHEFWVDSSKPLGGSPTSSQRFALGRQVPPISPQFG